MSTKARKRVNRAMRERIAAERADRAKRPRFINSPDAKARRRSAIDDELVACLLGNLRFVGRR
jgi:hypothetical protein